MSSSSLERVAKTTNPSLAQWHATYTEALKRYNVLEQQQRQEMVDRIHRISDDNPYRNTITTFPDSDRTVSAYVTNEGVVKPILEPEMMDALKGLPKKRSQVSWQSAYNNPNQTITDLLISGTPVEPNQELGLEGTHLVSDRYPKAESTYVGCQGGKEQPNYTLLGDGLTPTQCRETAYVLAQRHFAMANILPDGKGQCLGSKDEQVTISKPSSRCGALDDPGLYGGLGNEQEAIAWHRLNDLPPPSLLQEVGYIDGDARLHVYKKDALLPTDTYSLLHEHIDVSGVPVRTPLLNYSLTDCKAACTKQPDCDGVQFRKDKNSCELKSIAQLRDPSVKSYLPESNVYLRHRRPKAVPPDTQDVWNTVDMDTMNHYLRDPRGPIDSQTNRFRYTSVTDISLNEQRAIMDNAMKHIQGRSTELAEDGTWIYGPPTPPPTPPSTVSSAEEDRLLQERRQRAMAMVETSTLEVQRQQMLYGAWALGTVMIGLVSIRMFWKR